MNKHAPSDIPRDTSEPGMGRFLDPDNLARYRKLASDKMDAGERRRVLNVLAQEWDIFLRECRMCDGRGVRAGTDDDASGGPDIS